MQHLPIGDYYKNLQWRLTLICVLASWTVIGAYNIFIISAEQREGQHFHETLTTAVPWKSSTTCALYTETADFWSVPTSNNFRPLDAPTIVEKGFGQYRNRLLEKLILLGIIISIISGIGIYYLIGFILKPAKKFAQEQEDFIANASHELKTPLATVKTEIASLDDEKNISHNVRESLDVIASEVNTMSDLVKNLLALSTISHQQKIEKINLSDLLQERIHKYHRSAERKQLHVALGKSLPIEVRTDRQKLLQILDILWDNAQKYSYPDTTVEFNLSEKSDRLYLTITNQGIGIDTADQTQVFQRFYRATNQEVSSRSGSGLGLAIAKKLADDLQLNLVLIDGRPQKTTFALIFDKYLTLDEDNTLFQKKTN